MRSAPTGADEAPHIYSREYFQRLHELAERHWWVLGMRSIAERLLDPLLLGRTGVRVLDAGCGTGGNLSWLERYAARDRIVGIDFSPVALTFCHQDGRRHVAQASIMELPFPDGSFDLVNCTDVIQHLPRDGADRTALAECYRVLQPGGLLFLRTNVYPGGNHEEPPAEVPAPLDYHQYTLGELAGLIAEAGFAIEKVSHGNMLPALMTTWLPQLSCSDIRPYTPGTDRGHRMRVPPPWVNAVLKAYMRGEAWYMARRQRVLPFGHSLIALTRKPADARSSSTPT